MIQELFFELIRVAIGNQDQLSHVPIAEEWQQLYNLSIKQSLTGVCFAALKRLGADSGNGGKNIGLREGQYFTWMGMALQIVQRNDIVNRQCKELHAKLSKSGLSSCVLKGQGIASLYGEQVRGLRQSGDIDAWVKGGFDVVNEFVQKTAPTEDIAYHRFHYNIFDDTEVELHHRPTLMRNLFDDRKLQKWCDGFKADSFVHNELGFDVPPIEFNRLFILTHIYRHFLFEGVGLRQVMDYYFVLINGTDNHSVANLLKQFRLTRFASSLMWVMRYVFGLEEKYLICEPNDKEGRFLLEEIMETGNFGFGDTRYNNQGKLQKMVRRRLHLIRHYPSEVMWTPIWLIFHKFWKYKYKRKTRSLH